MHAASKQIAAQFEDRPKRQDTRENIVPFSQHPYSLVDDNTIVGYRTSPLGEKTPGQNPDAVSFRRADESQFKLSSFDRLKQILNDVLAPFPYPANSGAMSK